MAGARRSKRLAGDAPPEHATPKRVRRANTNTLAEFSKQQSPLRVDTRPKKKPTKLIDPLEASPEPVDVISPLPVDLALPSSPPVVRKSPVEINSSPVRAPKNKTETPLPFDPTVEQLLPHWVSVFITPVIDGTRKVNDTYNRTVNINDVFRPSWHTLNVWLYNKYIKGWAARRSIPKHQEPRISHWIATTGPPKGNYEISRIDDEVSWLDLLTRLRQMYKDGDYNRKNCFKVVVDAIYSTYDREKTPPALPQVKGKGKAQPHTVRSTPLFGSPSLFNGPPIVLTSDPPEEEEYDPNEVPIEKEQAPLPKQLSNRDSSTKQQLHKKASKDKGLRAKAFTRQQLFATHICTEENCQNFRGACYVLRSKRTHHKLMGVELDQWAELIVAGLGDISLKCPPTEWLAEWMEGRNAMTIKGRRPAKTAVPAPPVAPPVAPAYTQYPPPWAYPQYVLPAQAQPVQERPDPPRFERESQPPPPSSPIREHRDATTGSADIIT
jgi:hypothetical protein